MPNFFDALGIGNSPNVFSGGSVVPSMYFNTSNPMSNFGSSSGGNFWSSALPTLGSALGLALGGSQWENPAEAAMPYLQKIPGTMSPYYQPYMTAGKTGLRGLGDVASQYQSLISSPASQLNQFGRGYRASPGYKWNVDQATRAANQAAAASGMAGSPAEQAELAKYTSGLASQDYNTYLQNVLGLYGQGLGGLSGLSQFESELGAGMSKDLAQSLAANLMSQAGLQYAGQAAQNQASQGMFGGLGGLLGGLASSALPFLF